MAKVRFLLKEPQHDVEAKKRQPTLVLFVYRVNAKSKVVYSIREYISPNEWDFVQQLPLAIKGRSDLSELRIKQYMDYIMLYEDEIAEEYENHPFFTANSDK